MTRSIQPGRRPGKSWRLTVLLLLPQTGALAGVKVTPRGATVAAGSTCAFEATLEGKDLDVTATGGWRWTLLEGPGELDETTGLYRAPGPETVAPIRVQASPRGRPDLTGEVSALVLPLPPEVPGLVSATMGEAWALPYASTLPFLDLETGKRVLPGSRITPCPNPYVVKVRDAWLVAYGIPFTFPFARFEDHDAMRLSYREGDQVIRRDFDGRGLRVIQEFELVCHGKVRTFTLEALKRCAGHPDAWRSTILTYPASVRGLLPFCGNPVAPGGHQDGTGFSARFRQPFGLGYLYGQDSLSGDDKRLLLVTDAQSHVVRSVTAQGEVGTFCGQPDQAGHQDSPFCLSRMAALFGRPSPPPLFHSPTHMAVRWIPEFSFIFPQQEALVADSGNHVIRKVRLNGTVTTLAGTPGRAGDQDSPDPAAASFNDPQGLAADNDGWVFVADRGNRLIRTIAPWGQVGTLAGSAAAAGSLDGVGRQARFSRLKGLCLDPIRPCLYVLDGHALRRVELPGGQVTTLLGVADQPGFRDIREADHALRLEASRGPCLNDPTGIIWSGGLLKIADRGNNAVRKFNPEDLRLDTLLGDPGQCATRWGLVRDSLPGPLDARYGALEGPWTLAERSGEVVVTSGRCVAELNHHEEGRDRLVLTGSAEPLEAVVGESCAATFTVATLTSARRASSRAVHYTADFMDPDGERCVQVQGRAAGGETVVVQGRFAQAGTGTILLRGVSAQGLSAWAEVKVRIR